MSDNQNNEIRSSAGTFLKRLREEKNLSIEDVSTRLYLQPHIIEALEQDDHESLPTGTYVYGYLQNYAKLLDTPADQVVAMYKDDITEQPEQVPQRQPKPKTGQSIKWPYTILYLVVFAALLLPFTWWRSQYTQEATISAGAGGNRSGGNAATSGLSYPITIVEHPDTPFYRAPNTERAASAQQPGFQATNPDREFDNPADPYDGNMITTGIGPDSIRIVLTDDCWIEIFDANNDKVFYDLARSDQILVLNGTAPFSVLLGNGEAAAVEFNAMPIDTTPYMSRIGMARFVLGEEQAGR